MKPTMVAATTSIVSSKIRMVSSVFLPSAAEAPRIVKAGTMALFLEDATRLMPREGDFSNQLLASLEGYLENQSKKLSEQVRALRDYVSERNNRYLRGRRTRRDGQTLETLPAM